MFKKGKSLFGNKEEHKHPDVYRPIFEMETKPQVLEAGAGVGDGLTMSRSTITTSSGGMISTTTSTTSTMSDDTTQLNQISGTIRYGKSPVVSIVKESKQGKSNDTDNENETPSGQEYPEGYFYWPKLDQSFYKETMNHTDTSSSTRRQPSRFAVSSSSFASNSQSANAEGPTWKAPRPMLYVRDPRNQNLYFVRGKGETVLEEQESTDSHLSNDLDEEGVEFSLYIDSPMGKGAIPRPYYNEDELKEKEEEKEKDESEDGDQTGPQDVQGESDGNENPVADVVDGEEEYEDEDDDDDDGVKEVRIAVVGPQGVGKTTYIHQFVAGRFDRRVESTTSTRVYERSIHLNKQSVKVWLYDVRSPIPDDLYLELGGLEVDGFLYVYSCEKPFGLNKLEKVAEQVKQHAKERYETTRSKTPLLYESPSSLLVATKSDVQELELMDSTVAMHFKKENACEAFRELSGFDKLDVDESVHLLVQSILLRLDRVKHFRKKLK